MIRTQREELRTGEGAWNAEDSLLSDPVSSPEHQFDRALGQFIVSQGLAPAQHVQEFWTAGIYQSRRLATALIQYSILDATTLEATLRQFQDHYLFCSRCPLALQGRKNHYPRCPSCQAPWFEDSGWSPSAQAQQSIPQPPAPFVESEPDEEGSDESRSENSAEQEESWLHQTRASLLSHLPLIAAAVIAWGFFVPFGRASTGHKEFDYMARVFLKGTAYIFGYLLAVKGILRFLRRRLKLFTLFSIFALNILAIQSTFYFQSELTGLILLALVVLSPLLHSQLKDSESRVKLGWRCGLLIFFLLQVAPVLFFFYKFAALKALLWWLAR